jgi:hypothetical protein
VTYGPSKATVEEYRKLGRRRFLDDQLHPKDVRLPRSAADQIAALDLSHANAADLLATVFNEQQRINALPDETQKQVERKTLNDKGNKLAYEAARREILRALYSPAQLQEQLTWFWLNHFSVFQYKANDAWLVGDYAEHAVRPHALGHFRDLVMATLTHPAMLQYLDNAQNAAVYWILGGSVNGGRIAGEQTKVERANLFQDRDYPVLNEYRAVLDGLFTSLWGLSTEQVQRVFPASMPANLNLV